MRKNYDSFDIAKFFSACCVCSIHSAGGENVPAFMWMATPLFFLISSFLFLERLDGTQKDRMKLKRFVTKNYAFFLFWMLPMLAFCLVFSLPGKRTLFSHLFHLLVGAVLGEVTYYFVLWYISALISGVCFAFLFRKLPNWMIISLGLVLYFFCIASSNYAGFFERSRLLNRILHLYPFGWFVSFPAGLIWISLGKLFAERKKWLVQLPIKKCLQQRYSPCDAPSGKTSGDQQRLVCFVRLFLFSDPALCTDLCSGVSLACRMPVSIIFAADEHCHVRLSLHLRPVSNDTVCGYTRYFGIWGDAVHFHIHRDTAVLRAAHPAQKKIS